MRVYRIDRIWYVRRVDEGWVRQLAALIRLGVSVESLADAARRGHLRRLLLDIRGASSRVAVPDWLR